MPLLKTILKSFKLLRTQSLEMKIVGIHLLVENYFYIYGSKSIFCVFLILKAY